ncbi:hypothetical protein LMG27952_03976 [Paraburkholderia hiiakae]|uniref:Uncharacterized protein n=1 Tax=Paraburkholderia hiiakae TaxID=1081782 RepID=A0ABN7I010_9BURK|nr:hypothetical protein [Paraburkholderia hiiakae]CAD6543027.1 hypothetical protein LMG27952_03976 [Paraburkholderia hiiakae]
MNFIRGVLARARGELARIRPHRDFAGADLDPAIDNDTTPATPPHKRQQEDVAFVEPSRDVQPRGDVDMDQSDLVAPHRAASEMARAPLALRQNEGDRAPRDPRVATPPAQIANERTANPPAARARNIERLSVSVPRRRTDPEVPRADPRHAESARPPPAPATPVAPLQIDIHIGRVEVAPPPAPRVTSGTSRTAASTPRLTLADYLAQRSAKR